MYYDTLNLTSAVRKLMGEPVWHDDALLKLYLYCIAQASRDHHDFWGIVICPGDILQPERILANDLKWSRNKLVRKLRQLCDMGQITLDLKGALGTLIHLVHWEELQDDTCLPAGCRSGRSGSADDENTSDYLSTGNPIPSALEQDLLQSETRGPMRLSKTEQELSQNGDQGFPAVPETEQELLQNEHADQERCHGIEHGLLQSEINHSACCSKSEQELQQNGSAVSSPAIKTEPEQCQNETGAAPSCSEVVSKSDRTPYSNSIYSNKHNRQSIEKAAHIPEPMGFQEVWLSYPAARRTRRTEAAELFAQALSDGATVEAVLRALEDDVQSAAWQRENGQYIPGIVKWLQKETWRSYITQAAPERGGARWTSR